ncbi:hypothetical protein M0802_015983 [Mischocyttarus mexicanus]|nr:hypothetical protein M0802_015984 [Mischocyttarus mexicanus]KAI4473691.1 hypothetical protein M0802_015983 [Mischocyttarus mexicanus]
MARALCVLLAWQISSSLPDRIRPSLFLQLRVIRAFKSTLEDLEERRSVHSLHSLHSMRSSRSHTGPRPLSDFTYIDEDPTNATTTTSMNINNAAKNIAHNKNTTTSDQDHETNPKRSRITQHSINSPTSPLLLNVPDSAYNNHYISTTTANTAATATATTNNNRSSSNNALNQLLSSNPDTGNNSLLLSSNNLVLPELTKLVHETSI